jgi:hypothetical protein
MNTVNTELIDEVLYNKPAPSPTNPVLKGLVCRLNSPSSELDGAIVNMDREITDWDTHVSVMAQDYMRRRLRKLPEDGPVYAATVRKVAPGVGTNGSYGSYKSVWVHGSEVGIPYNESEKLTDEDKARYMENPTLCPFPHCDDRTRLDVVGVGFRSGTPMRVKIECQSCNGKWTEVMAVVGVE